MLVRKTCILFTDPPYLAMILGGLAGWESNSEVIHAVSNAGPAGPFAYHDTALVPWHHNPQAVQAPDGTWLISGLQNLGAESVLRPGPRKG